MNKITYNVIALRHYELVVKFLSHFPKKLKLLDAGCGEGYLAKRLVKIGFNVHACDTDKKVFAYKNIPFTSVNLNKGLSYKNNSFDIIVCLEVIEHLENPWFLISEFHRVLRDDGTLIISSPNISNCLARIYYLFTGKIWLFNEHYTDHINPVSYWEIASILKKSGFINTGLINGVDVINNVSIVTKLKNPFLKITYNLFFKTWGLAHWLLNYKNKKSDILFRTFSYIVHAKK